MELLIGFAALLVAGAGVILLAVMVSKRKSREQERVSKSPEEIAAEQRAELDRQAQAELGAGNLEQARRLFIAARRPGKAAQVAVREGKLELAARLFEADGRLDKALVAYRRAGVAAKVLELGARIAQGDGAKGEPDAAGTPPVGPEPTMGGAPAQDPFVGADPSDSFANLPIISFEDEEAKRLEEAASDAWLLEDSGLLDLPDVPLPATTAPAGKERAALGVMSLIKRKQARDIVEETVVAKRSDER